MTINHFSGFSSAHHDSGVFEKCCSGETNQKPVSINGGSGGGVANVIPSAPLSPLEVAPSIIREDLKVLMQALSSMLLILKRLFGGADTAGEQTVVPKTVQPEVSLEKDSKTSQTTEVQFPDISSMKAGEKPKNVWLEFSRKNRRTDNEPSIKAAMMRYGQSPRGVFSTINMSDAGYQIVMRDGFKLTLSPQEIEQAQKRSHIWSPVDPAMAKDINFMDAASVKRVQIEKGLDSFESALDYVQGGKDVGNGFNRLGLAAYVRKTTWPELHESRGLGVVMNPEVQFGFDGNVDCCSQRSSYSRMENGVLKPYPFDALELI